MTPRARKPTAYEEVTAATHGFVGYCPTCGLIYAAAVDYPSAAARNRKFVGELVKDGANIGKLENDVIRALPWCHCPRREVASRA
jgi:hypothetical protein